MKTIKKHIEIYKLNKQIRKLHQEIIPPLYIGNNIERVREDEKTYIMRESMNKLIDQRELIKNS